MIQSSLYLKVKDKIWMLLFCHVGKHNKCAYFQIICLWKFGGKSPTCTQSSSILQIISRILYHIYSTIILYIIVSMVVSLVTGLHSKTCLGGLGFPSFTTPVCCPHSNPHGAVSEALWGGELQEGSWSWESLEKVIHCALGAGLRDEQEAHARRQDSLKLALSS